MIEALAKQKISKNYRGLGTVIDLTVFGLTDASLLDATFELIQHYEDIFTVNRAESEIMSINKAAGLKAVQVSPAVYQLVKKSIDLSLRHFGFNACIGPLVKLWHIGFRDARRPSDAEIRSRLRVIQPEKVEVNDENQSVFLKESGMELDLGAIAKGYIADRISDFWSAYGVQSGIINLGGNLLLLGEAVHQPDRLWRVGIRHPLKDVAESIAIIYTAESSVVTSGIGERYLEMDGKSYHHIIDPETGYPHDNEIASITVLTPESIDGEIETTRLFFADKTVTNYPYRAVYVYRNKSIELVGIPESRFHIINSEFYLKENE